MSLVGDGRIDYDMERDAARTNRENLLDNAALRVIAFLINTM